MKAWLEYAAVSLVVTVVLAGAGALLVPAEWQRGVWFAAVVAWSLQLLTFAALVAVRGRDEWFLAGWLAGLVARFGAVGVMAYWLGHSGALPREPVLLGMVTILFVLLLMEPLFLRRGLQTR